MDRGYFTRKDISTLGVAIHLGHNGERCPNSSGEVLFTVVDSNGVHSTRLSYCGCVGSGEKFKQLTRARLFPATTRDPRTAFTFSVLKQFHLHNLESKKSAYDYLGALRRLSDNAFTADVPVSIQCMIISHPLWLIQFRQNPYATFLRVVRVWRLIVVMMRLGQAFGIDNILTHRPPGNLVLYCPSCPEPGFNVPENSPKTPNHLR
jgi:CxC2 like cysteine cluster associated with KDZ transposases